MIAFAFLAAVALGILWNLLITVLVVWILNIVGIPALAALTFWQVFGLLVVISLATMKVSSD